MTGGSLTLQDISHLTIQVGEDWTVAHARRLIELVKIIGAQSAYDGQVIKLAAYLHDWGAFPSYTQKGVEHAVRLRRAAIQVRFTFPRAQEIARERLERMETGLTWLVEESFGVL